jgi:hypothetical protein
MLISQRAFDLIVACEVTGRAAYEKRYQRPTWPGGRSGITVGIGYDLGYCTLDKLHADFDGRISDTMIRVMTRCLGVTGAQAQATLPSVVNLVLIPWDVALAVFSDRDIPEWTERVCAVLPGAKDLPADCLGALVSLAYNRGAGGFTSKDDRFREMAAIRWHMTAGELGKIPGEFRAMKRLWPDMKGLRDRRDQEASLFAEGLIQRMPKTIAPPDAPKTVPHMPPDAPPVEPAPQPAPQPAKHATWGATLLAALVAATQSPSFKAALAVVVVGAIAAYLIHRFWPKGT